MALAAVRPASCRSCPDERRRPAGPRPHDLEGYYGRPPRAPSVPERLEPVAGGRARTDDLLIRKAWRRATRGNLRLQNRPVSSTSRHLRLLRATPVRHKFVTRGSPRPHSQGGFVGLHASIQALSIGVATAVPWSLAKCHCAAPNQPPSVPPVRVCSEPAPSLAIRPGEKRFHSVTLAGVSSNASRTATGSP